MGNFVVKDQWTQTPIQAATEERVTQTPIEVQSQGSQTEGIDSLTVVEKNSTYFITIKIIKKKTNMKILI